MRMISRLREVYPPDAGAVVDALPTFWASMSWSMV
jgi:hypothetical protein